eukprot:scaffold12296_cov27-Tisochrysis_lutea.AAC.1
MCPSTRANAAPQCSVHGPSVQSEVHSKAGLPPVCSRAVSSKIASNSAVNARTTSSSILARGATGSGGPSRGSQWKLLCGPGGRGLSTSSTSCRAVHEHAAPPPIPSSGGTEACSAGRARRGCAFAWISADVALLCLMPEAGGSPPSGAMLSSTRGGCAISCPFHRSAIR